MKPRNRFAVIAIIFVFTFVTPQVVSAQTSTAQSALGRADADFEVALRINPNHANVRNNLEQTRQAPEEFQGYSNVASMIALIEVQTHTRLYKNYFFTKLI